MPLASKNGTTGSLPPEVPFFEASGIKLYADEKNVAAVHGPNLADVLRAHISRLGAGDYFAVLGYITMNDQNEKTLQGIRHAMRDKKRVATVLGFGPRFLHSTGQAYKGGPNSGVFLQITDRKSTRLNSSHSSISYAVFCLKKKRNRHNPR